MSEYPAINPFQWHEHLGSFQFRATKNNAAMNIQIHIFYEHVHISVVNVPRSGNFGSWTMPVFIFGRKCQFPKVVAS